MKKLDIVSFSVHVAAFILILCVPPCGSLYNCNVHPDQPILCQDNQISTASRQCDGEASICDAVSSWDLILNCSLCSSAKEVQWKRDTVPLPYHTAVAKIPAKDVEPSDSGCYTCVCYGKSHSFSVAIQAAECPHLLVENDTSGGVLYIYPEVVETELNETSEGVLKVNCTNSAWPPSKTSWSLSSAEGNTSVFNFPNYNVTENGQVLVILFPSRKELPTLVTYYCHVSNAVGDFQAEQQIHLQAFYDYFLTPHESQSQGSVTDLVAYCAVNPEDGVEIYYTVCAYHGGKTDLDWVAASFIANGSSECCLCGMCDEGVLGPGVTATISSSPPNLNNFSVSAACQVRSKAVGGSFVCLAHRETELYSSMKQALGLFHFQPPQICFSIPTIIGMTVAIIVQCPFTGVDVLIIIMIACKCIWKCGRKPPRSSGTNQPTSAESLWGKAKGDKKGATSPNSPQYGATGLTQPVAVRTEEDAEGSTTLTESGKRGKALYYQVQKIQSNLLDGIKLDAKLLGNLHQRALVTRTEYNEIDAHIMGHNVSKASTYFVNSVLFKWYADVFEDNVRRLIEALKSHDDGGNHSVAKQLRTAILKCGLDAPVPCLEAASS